MSNPEDTLKKAFDAKGWKVIPFQKKVWSAYADGKSGLVHAPTGAGKTLSIWAPVLLEWMHEDSASKQPPSPGLQVLWITPLRALAKDTARSLMELCLAMNVSLSVEMRTGDTSGTVKSRQKKSFPHTLVTTPESLALLLSDSETKDKFSNLKAVIIDEWHELLGSKRGVQTELGLARLRQWNPLLKIWGLSATLGNLEEALNALLGPGHQGILINGDLKKVYQVKTVIPSAMSSFPWSGHLGLRLINDVVEAIDQAETTLVFTNVRSQTESWFGALLKARPDWEKVIALHHGSLNGDIRSDVENRLQEGLLKAVVCTSSLDLGVDFSPVEQVIQIGGPKGIARLLQRAGRSGHQPGSPSKIICVPTQAMEMIEYSAARDAIQHRQIETRLPVQKPLDLLSQHMVTIALGGGFKPQDLLEEIRTTWSYRLLTDSEWHWTLDFVLHGGQALNAYEQYKKVVKEDDRIVVTSKHIARFHRMSIGTITSDHAVRVKFLRGQSLGTLEESFIAKMRPGSHFVFGGHRLKLVRVKDMTAWVRKAKGKSGIIPTWGGGHSPLSSELARGVRMKLQAARTGAIEGPEMKAVQPMLSIQGQKSMIPDLNELLIERIAYRGEFSWFVFPFAGRMAHEGLAALLSYRISLKEPMTIAVSFNDYGLQLRTNSSWDISLQEWRACLSPEHLIEDLLACVNATELARRQFREVARVAGLIFSGYPKAKKAPRHIQASSDLLFEVFQQYDSHNLLLHQSRCEVLDRHLELKRLTKQLLLIRVQNICIEKPDRLTPFSFPLWADSLRAQISSEKWEDRIRKMVSSLEGDVA